MIAKTLGAAVNDADKLLALIDSRSVAFRVSAETRQRLEKERAKESAEFEWLLLDFPKTAED